MAIDQAPYCVVRFGTIEKAVRWSQNRLNLRDWVIDIYYGEQVPLWANPKSSLSGQSETDFSHMRAKVWINPEGCKVADYHPVAVAIHEVLHIFFHNYDIVEHDERMINTMEEILFKQWQAEKRR